MTVRRAGEGRCKALNKTMKLRTSNPAKSPSSVHKNAASSDAEYGKNPLTDHQLALLRSTFALVEPKAGIAGLVFYRNLFNLDPSLRRLFQTSIELQARKLMESLGYTIASFEQPESLISVLEPMGRRHAGYGVCEEHYDTVIRAMLQTLDDVLGGGFSAEAREAWKQALSFVARAMKAGAARSVEK